MIFIYNGFAVTNMIYSLIMIGTDGFEILHLMAFHGIFEMTAFIWLGAVGLKGFGFYKKLINSGFNRSMFLSYKDLIIPNILILLAAVVEIFYGIFNNMITSVPLKLGRIKN